MNFKEFYTLPKARITKHMLNLLEIALCSYIEQWDACLAVDSTGNTRVISASDLTTHQLWQLAAFVDGWLYAKGI